MNYIDCTVAFQLVSSACDCSLWFMKLLPLAIPYATDFKTIVVVNCTCYMYRLNVVETLVNEPCFSMYIAYKVWCILICNHAMNWNWCDVLLRDTWFPVTWIRHKSAWIQAVGASRRYTALSIIWHANESMQDYYGVFNGKSWCFKSPTIRLTFFPSASVRWKKKTKKKHVWYYWSSMRIWWREGIPHKGLWWGKRLLVITLSCRSLTHCILVTQYSCKDLSSALLSWWFVAWRHRHDLMKIYILVRFDYICMRAINLFHNIFPPSGTQPEHRNLAHEL